MISPPKEENSSKIIDFGAAKYNMEHEKILPKKFKKVKRSKEYLQARRLNREMRKIPLDGSEQDLRQRLKVAELVDNHCRKTPMRKIRAIFQGIPNTPAGQAVPFYDLKHYRMFKKTGDLKTCAAKLRKFKPI